MATITNNVRWADNTQELKKNLLEGIGTIDAMKASVDRTVASLGGQGLFMQANKVAAAIQELGGITKLSAAEQERANSILDKAIEKYKLMGMTAPPAMVSLRDSMKEAGEATGGLIGYINNLGDSFVAHVAEGMLLRDVIREIISLGKEAFSDAASFVDLSKATGISIQGIQQFNYVGQEFGLGASEMARGVEQLSAKLANGDKNATSAVQMLGLSVKDLLKEDPQSMFLDVADAAGRVEDPMQKAGIVTDLFGGKLGKVLLPALAELRVKFDEAANSGAIMSDATAQHAHDFEVKWEHAITTLKARLLEFYDLATRQGSMTDSDKQAVSDVYGGAAPKPTGGSDIELTITRTDLLANKLKALRTDSLEPLTQAQKDNITQLKSWGEGEQEIAKDVGANVISIHLYLEAQKAAAEAAKKSAEEAAKWKKVLDDVNSAGTSWQGTLAKMNPTVVENGLALLDAGVKAEKVGEYYGLTETQTKALSEQQEFLAAASGATAKEFHNLGMAVVPDLSEHAAHLQDVLGELDSTVNEFQDGITVAGDTMSTVTIPLFTTLPHVVEQSKKAIDDARNSMKTFSQEVGTNLMTTLRDVPMTIARAFTGGGGLLDAFENIGSKAGEAIGGAIGKTMKGLGKLGGPIGEAIGSLVGPLIGWIANIGGPSKQELAGRSTEADFEKQMGGWQGIQKALLATGLTADQVNAKIKALWASETQGADAVATQIDGINKLLNDQKQDDADLQTAIQKYGFTIDQLGPTMQKQKLDEQAQGLLNDWRLLVGSGIQVATVNTQMASSVQDYLTMALKTGQEVPEAMKPILQSMVDQGLLTDQNGDKLTDLKNIKWSETMSEGFQKVVDKLDELLTKIGMVPGVIAKIPTTIDVGVNFTERSDLPTPIPMAAGGAGRVTRPTLFLVGEQGAEDYAFSGGGRSFGGGSTESSGGAVVVNNVVTLDGRVLYQDQVRHQGRDLRTRRKVAAA